MDITRGSEVKVVMQVSGLAWTTSLERCPTHTLKLNYREVGRWPVMVLKELVFHVSGNSLSQWHGPELAWGGPGKV
jgi:hypothetical protein